MRNACHLLHLALDINAKEKIRATCLEPLKHFWTYYSQWTDWDVCLFLFSEEVRVVFGFFFCIGVLLLRGAVCCCAAPAAANHPPTPICF